jgi:hypothetical protein
MLEAILPIFLVLMTVGGVHAYAQIDNWWYQFGNQSALKDFKEGKDFGFSSGLADTCDGLPRVCVPAGIDFAQGYTDEWSHLQNETAGYQTGLQDYNQHVNDTSHHFECAMAKLAPHSQYCLGYDKALQYMMSDQ